MRKIVFLSLFLFSSSVWANCPIADSFFKKGKDSVAVSFLQTCAVNYNDDESQVKLAKAHMSGDYGLEKNPQATLYYYQLAAETGNAEAQLALAEILMKADEKPETRDELLNYRAKVKPAQSDLDKNVFNGDFVHPYALLMLASESADKKWYYPSQVRIAPPKATSLLKSYRISEDRKREAKRQASQFKTRKLLQTAKEVCSADEYVDMQARLKNPQTQAQALVELKQKMEEYIRLKKETRKSK